MLDLKKTYIKIKNYIKSNPLVARAVLVAIFYILIVNIYVLGLGYFEKTQLSEFSFKELLFGIWGYNWDGGLYLRIATHGYGYPLQAFFPLFPLMIKILDIFLPLTLSYRVNAALLPITAIGIVFLAKKMNIESPIRAVIIILAFPSAFFLQASYTENIFILISTISLLVLLNNKYVSSAAMAGLLTFLKISGISFGFTVFMSYISTIKKVTIKSLLKAALIGLIANWGIILYFTYLHLEFGSFGIFFRAQGEWARNSGSWIYYANNLDVFFQHTIGPTFRSFHTKDIAFYRESLQVFSVFYILLLLVLSFRKIDWRIWLFSFLNYLIPLSTASFLSFNRLALLCFPLLIFSSKYIKGPLLYIYVIAGITLQGIGLYLFLNNVFVG